MNSRKKKKVAVAAPPATPIPAGTSEDEDSYAPWIPQEDTLGAIIHTMREVGDHHTKVGLAAHLLNLNLNYPFPKDIDPRIIEDAKKSINPIKPVSSHFRKSYTVESIGKKIPHGHEDLQNPKSPNRAWSSLFSLDQKEDAILTKIEVNPGEPIEFTDDEILEDPNGMWSNSLVGHYIGPKLHYLAINGAMQRAWGGKLFKLIMMDDGFVIFRFEKKEDLQFVLEGGPWFVKGQALILKKWSPECSLQKEDFSHIPIWITLPNLNFSLRNAKALSKIGSVVGKPLYMDKATAQGTRLDSARICVEINPKASLPEVIQLKVRGSIINQKIKYLWRPNPCQSCNTFSHSANSCPVSSGKAIQQTKQTCPSNENESHISKEEPQITSSSIPIKESFNDGKSWVVARSKKSKKVTHHLPPSNTSHVLQDEANSFLPLSDLDGIDTLLAGRGAGQQDKKDPMGSSLNP